MKDAEMRSTEGRSAGRLEFFLAFVVAAAGGFLLPTQAEPWLLAAWGAGWMLVYLLAVRLRWPAHFATADFADNFYYLGFLLTLAALAAVLVRLGEMSDDVLRAVLGQFGLALVTTIVGLTGRTILLMSRTTLRETEERSGQQVARAFDDFTRSLTRLSAEADAFAAGFGHGLRSSLARIEGEVDAFAQSAAATRERLGAVRGALDGLGGALSGTASDVQASGQQLAVGLRDLGTATAPRLTEIGAQLDDVLRRLREASELLQRVAQGADSATEDTLERLTRVAAGLGLSLSTVAKAAQDATEGLQGQAGGMADVVRQWREQADQLARVHEQLVREAEGSGTAVAQVRREIAAGVEALIEELRSASPAPAGPLVD